MSPSMTPADIDPRFAQRCWREIHHAMLSEDDRAPWHAWKKYFPLCCWPVERESQRPPRS